MDQPERSATHDVLLVHDDERAVVALRSMLQSAIPSVMIQVATGGSDAAWLLTRHAFCAVITPLSLVDGSGDYVLAVSASVRPQALRILMTDVGTHSDRMSDHVRVSELHVEDVIKLVRRAVET